MLENAENSFYIFDRASYFEGRKNAYKSGMKYKRFTI